MTSDGRALVSRKRPLRSQRPAAGADRAAASAESPVLALQRGAGNRAVASLLGGQAEEEETARLPRQASAGPEAGDGELAPGLRSYLSRSRGHGRPLEAAARRSLERSFGRGLGGVRVHTGPAAAWAARSIRARAFALGKDIWFGADEYRPRDVDGRRLLAHEVAHTIDEPGNVSLDSVRLGRVDDSAEARADRAAEAAVRGRSAPPAFAPEVHVA
jgi:hypothetical protein